MTPFPSRSFRAAAAPPSLRSAIRAILAGLNWRHLAPPPTPVAQPPTTPESDFKLELERRLLGQ